MENEAAPDGTEEIAPTAESRGERSALRWVATAVSLTAIAVAGFAVYATTGADRKSEVSIAAGRAPHVASSPAAVMVGDVSVGYVPAGMMLGTGSCNFTSATDKCWSGTVQDPAAAAAAITKYGTAETSLVIKIDARPAVTGENSTTTTVDGVSVVRTLVNVFEFASFTTHNGSDVDIRIANLSDDELTKIVSGILAKS